MIDFKKIYRIKPDHDLDLSWSIQKAEQALHEKAYSLTDEMSPLGLKHINEYYSNGDYWWPDPDKEDGLPYIRRDGYSNPDNFTYHRTALRKTRTSIAHLARAYQETKDELYADKAVELLKVFFIDKKTAMIPHLMYAQAIPGLYTGRGIGIIDTLPLVEIPFAISALNGSKALSHDVTEAIVIWFKTYLEWMTTHPYGIDEQNEANNHSICYFVQTAAFSLFTDNMVILDWCRDVFTSRLIKQMSCDGAFPKELARTKPYGYAMLVLDNFTILCHVLSDKNNNLWEYEDNEGRSIKKAVSFLLPYLLDKNTWPYPKDVMHYSDYPSRMSFMLFAGYSLGIQELIDLYRSLPDESTNDEVRRNTTIRQPFLWL